MRKTETSRRTFIKSGAAILAASAVPAFAVPSVDAEIESVVTEFERHGFKISVVVEDDKKLGHWMQLPKDRVDFPNEMECHQRYNDCFKYHRAELGEYLVRTGRVSPRA